MIRVFADTYDYLAIMSPDDTGHERAHAWSVRQTARVVTSQWVLMEVADTLASTKHRHSVAELYRMLELDALTVVEPFTQEVFQDALKFYNARPDKHWSLTDCTSFVIMKRSRIREALTAGRHFVQAGYKALLK